MWPHWSHSSSAVPKSTMHNVYFASVGQTVRSWDQEHVKQLTGGETRACTWRRWQALAADPAPPSCPQGNSLVLPMVLLPVALQRAGEEALTSLWTSQAACAKAWIATQVPVRSESHGKMLCKAPSAKYTSVHLPPPAWPWHMEELGIKAEFLCECWKWGWTHLNLWSCLLWLG